MPSVLPRLSFDETLDDTRIYSVANLLSGDTLLVRHRSFRAPHHTISLVGPVTLSSDSLPPRVCGAPAWMSMGSSSGRRFSLFRERLSPMLSAVRDCEAHVSGLARSEEEDRFTAAPVGHSAPTLVIHCVSIHEWIELYNDSGQTVDLGGWMLHDEPEGTPASPQGSAPYVIPAGTIIEAGGFRVFYRRSTGLVLNNDGDEVRPLGPDGAVLDSVVYDSAARDGSWSRTVDGGGVWTDTYAPSPGGPNIAPPPTATPTIIPTRAPGQDSVVRRIRISAETARHKYAGTRVIVEGQVKVPPPLFGRSIYIQDHTGGIMVSLYRGDFPSLVEGDWLEVRGRLSDYHGERPIWVTRSSDLRRTGSGPPVQPLLIRSGEARVYSRESVGFRRPWVEVGEVWSVVGIVSQYVRSRPYVAGYRLLPRREADLSNAPLLLPVTGGERVGGGCCALQPAAGPPR
jgi:hypothetical protein